MKTTIQQVLIQGVTDSGCISKAKNNIIAGHWHKKNGRSILINSSTNDNRDKYNGSNNDIAYCLLFTHMEKYKQQLTRTKKTIGLKAMVNKNYPQIKLQILIINK